MTNRFQSGVRRAANMTAGLLLAGLAVTMVPAALGQALPAAEASPISTGFAMPRSAGSLQYAVSAGESLSWGFYGNQGSAAATNLTGDLAYLSSAKANPFSMVFSGGRSWATSNEPSYSFLNLALSQVIQAGRWNFTVADAVDYLPETPSTGLSGVPGAGDLGVAPVQIGADAGQGVLTDYSNRVTNTVSVGLARPFTGKTTFTASGAYSVLRFLGDSSGVALDSDQESGNAGINHRVDARNTFGGNYSYSNFTYNGGVVSGFTSQTASALYTHQFTRKLGVSLAAGPQWTGFGSSSATQAVTVFADAIATYTGEFSGAALSFVRSSNSGYGVTEGSLSNSVVGTAQRSFGRVWSAAVTASYTQTVNLPAPAALPFSADTTITGVQVSRAIAKSLSGYASYTLEDQTHQSSAGAVDLFDGLAQVVAFGLTYSPTLIHLGRP
jgi:hypothetical protein